MSRCKLKHLLFRRDPRGLEQRLIAMCGTLEGGAVMRGRLLPAGVLEGAQRPGSKFTASAWIDERGRAPSFQSPSKTLVTFNLKYGKFNQMSEEWRGMRRTFLLVSLLLVAGCGPKLEYGLTQSGTVTADNLQDHLPFALR
jgi:hypothetical protein